MSDRCQAINWTNDGLVYKSLAKPIIEPLMSCIWSLLTHKCTTLPLCIYTLRLRQNGRHWPDNTFKCIILNENVWIVNKISLKFVPKGPIDGKSSLGQIMAWRRAGAEAIIWTNDGHIYTYIYAPLSLNELNDLRPIWPLQSSCMPWAVPWLMNPTCISLDKHSFLASLLSLQIIHGHSGLRHCGCRFSQKTVLFWTKYLAFNIGNFQIDFLLTKIHVYRVKIYEKIFSFRQLNIS